MASLKSIKKRIVSVKNTRQITKAMKMVSAAKLRRAQENVVAARPYARKLGEVLQSLAVNLEGDLHPLLEKREVVKNSVMLVLSSNRGLCGGYNASLLRELMPAIRRNQAEGANIHIELSGKRAIAYCRFQGIPADRTYTHFEEKPTFEEVDVLASRYIADYIAGKIDRVEVAYTKFINAARQQAVVETLLPLSNLTPGAAAKVETPKVEIEYEFEPSANDILQELLPTSFKVRLFKTFLDAAVSEQIARRVAMKAATESAGDMIKELSREYNRARQAQITKEISEIIGGVEALK